MSSRPVDGVVIQPLSKQTLRAATALAHSVFPHQPWWQQSRWAFALSLRSGFLAKMIVRIAGVAWCKYWVAVDSRKEVIGVTGLYAHPGEMDTCWLGWTCVADCARGQGLGRQLIDFSIAEARSRCRSVVKLYTWDEPPFALARQMYERRRFVLTHQVAAGKNGHSGATRYFQCKLD